MGKGFENYMSKKWFHPTNIDNQKRLYAAEQKSIAEKKRQQDLRDQYEREQEVFSSKQLMGDEKARLGLAFMYNAPGSLKDQQDKLNNSKKDTKNDWDANAPRDSAPINTEKYRTMRCLKCKRLGHVNTDKSCPLYGRSRLDADDAELFSELDRQSELAASKLEIKREPVESELENSDPRAENMEITLEMLGTLSKKEKKALLKRLVKLEKKVKRAAKK